MSNLNDPVIRTARGGDRWFPGNEPALRTAVEGYMASAMIPETNARIVSAVAPHAGYMYSGGIAGYTFKALRQSAAKHGQPETLVLLGLSHRMPFSGVAFMDGDAFSTPLGSVALDTEATDILVTSHRLLVADYTPHNGEHSAENQVPFIQAALPDTKLVIGLTGDHDWTTIEAATAGLQELAKHRSLVCVASTDLLHDADYDLVTDTDHATLEMLQALKYEALWNEWSYQKQLCCGISAVCIAMRFAETQGCTRGAVLHYRNSGDDFPESRGDWVVGYGSVVFAP